MYKFHFFKTAFLLITVFGFITACTKSRDSNPTSNAEIKTFNNLYAPQTGGQGTPTGGPFTKFSFSAGNTVTDDNWDIAFRGTTIIVNGGSEIGITDEPARTGNAAVSIVKNTLEGITTIPEASSFKQDGTDTYAIPTGSGNGWYNYNQTTHIITPIAGQIFVVKTYDGKYAKFEIISFYEDAISNPVLTTPSNYYTFKYVYLPEGSSF